MKKRKIYIVCPVAKLTETEKKKINQYVQKLERQGHQVHLPYRDTDQVDEIGLRIMEEHEKKDILWADEVHVWWNPTSRGSLGDFAQARIVQYFKPLKIVLINEADVEITRDKRTKKIRKSHTNVLLAMHFGLDSRSTGADLLRAKQRAHRSSARNATRF